MFQEIGECMTIETDGIIVYSLVLLCLQFFFRDSCGPAVFFPCFCRTATPYQHYTVLTCLIPKKYRAHQGDEQHRRDHQLLHEQLLEQNWDLREAHEKSLNEMEELKRFPGSTFDIISRRRSIEDRDTILELTGKIQELQNVIDCMNDSRDF